jgi:hypothetical protein
MDNDYSVYQRTDLGRSEIRRKSHGLTQSERLVLILIDGVTPRSDVRNRLQGMTDERFTRALYKLHKNNLIEEVLLQVANPVSESVDDSTADAFLRQDPLDPVTIISFEPEEEFGDHQYLGEHETSQENRTTTLAPSALRNLEPSSSERPSISAANDQASMSTLAGSTPAAITLGPRTPFSAQQRLEAFQRADTASKHWTNMAKPTIPSSPNQSTWRYWTFLLSLSILAAAGVLVL